MDRTSNSGGKGHIRRMKSLLGTRQLGLDAFREDCEGVED